VKRLGCVLQGEGEGDDRFGVFEMKSKISLTLVAAWAVGSLCGCQSTGVSSADDAKSAPASFSMMADPQPGVNSGEFVLSAKDAAVPQVGFTVVGQFDTVVGSPRSSNPAVQNARRAVLKLKPVAIPGFPAPRDYAVVISATQKADGPNWGTNSTKRLFRNGARVADEVAEPSVDLFGSGTVVVSGTGPILTVKKATVASDGTKFIVEATPSGEWTLAVLEAATPVDVYFENSPDPVRVTAGKCLRVKETATVIPQPIDDPQLYAKLQAYARFLWGATGSSLD